ncbi:MAG: ABC transporter ATP-binding protein [Solirubrobacterales bacterium]|nr:ABC transporter ATP-binding protein [Solirubrobacterales bacterium]
MQALRARGLVKRYESTLAVDGVDLAMPAGEVRGLLGPNGAGKTTLLRMLFGLVRPDDGAIELLGRPLNAPFSIPLEGTGGFVEEPCFYPYLSGRANLELLAQLDGVDPGAVVDELLARVDLHGRAADRVSGYSTGMRQRLGIAAALLRSPRLLLLDEPTSGLDPVGARAVAELVRELSAQGVAVLLSSHLIGELENVCDAYTFLRHGRVVWDGSADRLAAEAPASAFTLHTSDDDRAAAIAAAHRGVRAGRSPRGALAVAVGPEGLDGFSLALGQAGVAIRRLELLVSPLESMFFALTADTEATLHELGPHELAERALAKA